MLTQLMVVILLLWAGMILGISFLESWVKFRAPSLTRSIGLDVGRTVFQYFHQAQACITLLVIALSIAAGVSLEASLVLIGLISIFSIQSLWLLPQLNERVRVIIAGSEPSPSYAHLFYGIIELMKLVMLCMLSFMLMSSRVC